MAMVLVLLVLLQMFGDAKTMEICCSKNLHP